MENRVTKRWGLALAALILPVAAGLFTGAGVCAQPNHQQPGGKPQSTPSKTQRQPSITASQAARRAGDKYGGKVLNVVLEHGPGGPYYQVKLLDGGSVRVVHIQAQP